MSTKPGPEKKLRPKYTVKKIPEEDSLAMTKVPLPAGTMLSTDPDNVDSPFVLMPRKDPAAYAAMIAYAQCCEPHLAAEIAEWLRKIANAPAIFGTQGTRNFTSTRSAAVDQI